MLRMLQLFPVLRTVLNTLLMETKEVETSNCHKPVMWVKEEGAATIRMKERTQLIPGTSVSPEPTPVAQSHQVSK